MEVPRRLATLEKHQEEMSQLLKRKLKCLHQVEKTTLPKILFNRPDTLPNRSNTKLLLEAAFQLIMLTQILKRLYSAVQSHQFNFEGSSLDIHVRNFSKTYFQHRKYSFFLYDAFLRLIFVLKFRWMFLHYDDACVNEAHHGDP